MAENQNSLVQFFEQTNNKLDRIEQGLIAQKTVLNFEDFCRYVGISKSYGYKLTSLRAVPHFCPHGKTLFFEKAEVDKWLLQNPIRTHTQLQKEVSSNNSRK
ncbi:DNA-binding protein [Emticicia soli]|uniref:DNA-binding protein n=1 Tax=Emticicia soli TaxID=2027878 RepID=A0ABW5J1P6_9BACT